MTRIFVDVGVYGQEWFQEILEVLKACDRVRFAYSDVAILNAEHERAFQVAQFYKLMGEIGRRDDADPELVQGHIDVLEANVHWQQERDCDDPHIFAIVYEKPARFVFSTDDDMANCRRCMNQVISSRYCRFRVVSRRETFEQHRAEILR